jgi:hypothetical protein
MAPNPNLRRLRKAGVSIWLDALSREMARQRLVRRADRRLRCHRRDIQPTIFAKPSTGSDRYDSQLRTLVAGGVRDPRGLFFSLALDEIRAAARLLLTGI